MKKIKGELDVDFIGGHDLLTEKDFERVSEIIKANKGKDKYTENRSLLPKRKKTTAVSVRIE